MLVSIFNDVIGPVMRGPSSSHCAAALLAVGGQREASASADVDYAAVDATSARHRQHTGLNIQLARKQLNTSARV